jgi:hypothetical protein
MEIGNGYHEVSFDDNEDIWIEENKCKAKKIVLSEKIYFYDISIELCKIAAAQNGFSIQFMSEESRNDPEICKIAAAQDGCSIQFMSEERRNDPEICKIAAAQNRYSIKFMSEERRNDPEICKIAGFPYYKQNVNYIQNNFENRILPIPQNIKSNNYNYNPYYSLYYYSMNYHPIAYSFYY